MLQEWKHAGFTSPAALSTLRCAIKGGTGMSDKRLELPVAVKLSNCVHRADRLTTDEEDWELRSAGQSEEKRNEDLRIS